MSEEIKDAEKPTKEKKTRAVKSKIGTARKCNQPSGIKGKRPSGLATGRPTLYNLSLAKRICDAVATHTDGMNTICEKFDDFPQEQTIRLWRFRYPEFDHLFNLAKMQQAQLFAESIDQESQNINTYVDKEGNVRYDSAHVAAKKLLTDNRRWLASTLAAKIYQRNQTIEIKTDSEDKDKEINKLKEELQKAYQRDY